MTNGEIWLKFFGIKIQSHCCAEQFVFYALLKNFCGHFQLN